MTSTVPRYSYVALDPGNTTGLAFYNRSGKVMLFEEMASIAINMVEEFVDTYKRYGTPLVVAVERVNVNSNTGGRGILRSLRWEMEVIGCARHFARKHGVYFAEYNGSDSKHVADNDTLRKLGWWLPGSDGHANDAARILAMAMREHDLAYWKHLVLESGVLESDPGEERDGSV